MLDIIKTKPGLSVNDITEHFHFTRYGAMKHLKVLEDAGLLVYRREGKFKKLYINVMPIQEIYDRWISKYSELWAKQLSSLKYKLEKEPTMAQELEHVFVTYIRTTKEKLWDAITNPDLTKQYFYGTEIKSDLKPGSKIEYHSIGEDGKVKIALFGEVLEVEPYKKFVHSFNFPDKGEKPSRAIYEIEEQGPFVKLTLTHDRFEGETETYKSVSEGWPFILSGLKSYLETGSSLS